MDSNKLPQIFSGILPRFQYLTLLFIIIFSTRPGISQPYPYYYAAYGHANGSLIHNTLSDEYHCTDCSFFKHDPIGVDFSGGISFSPEDSLYILSAIPDGAIYQVNTITADPVLIMQGPANLVKMEGLVAMGNGIFYSIPAAMESSQSLYRWDVNADTVTVIGELNYKPTGEMWMANGELYYLNSYSGPDLKIIRINLADPSNSEVALILPNHFKLYGLTASPVGSIFIGIEPTYFAGTWVVSVNLIDGTVTQICSVAKPFGGHVARHMTSRYEHSFNPSPVYLDLDCNNSSLATDSDFNSVPFDCFNEGGVPISDIDIKTQIDAYISSMTITVADPLNGSEEILVSTGNVSGIIVNGSGTPTMTLLSEGSARIPDFEEALRLIRYDNLALNPSAGTRHIHVQFETVLGTLSNIAVANIEVLELEAYPIDLGPDIELCEGSTVEIVASPLSVDYEWSTGETGQSIQVGESGTYSITVSGPWKCPNSDEIVVEELPVINISLTGDTTLCEGDVATLILTSDAPFPIEVEITSDPGFVQLFSDVEGTFTFFDSPFSNTEYLITNVISTETTCISIDDSYQIIEIIPDAQTYATVSLCEGDSILLGNEWVSDTGTYIIQHQMMSGCDSLVHYTLSLLPNEKIFIHEATCDSSLTGVFLSYKTNLSGCDTLVTTTVHLSSLDTTYVQETSCKAADTGVFQHVFQNQLGCDSIVMTDISWLPQNDPTDVIYTTCDSSQIGTYTQIIAAQNGCDSIIVVHVIADKPDTTQLFITSCDSSNIGVYEYHYLASNSCDSLIITTVSYSEQITTEIASGSCDPDQVGVFVNNYVSVFGCDSVVTHTITLFDPSETFISATSCDPVDVGNFTYQLINVYGCDSTVHETVTLLPHSETQVSRTSCLSSEVGIFSQILTNQYGCDSIITEVVTFVAGDTSEVTQYTCNLIETGSTETLFTTHDGCDSLVIQTTLLFDLPQLNTFITSDYNGFAVSCHGENDGALMASGTGIGPLHYQWSTGSTEQSIFGLQAGSYTVHITDGNGCSADETVYLTEPESLSHLMEIVQPDCILNQYGSIRIIPSGGVQPISYALDGNPYQASSEFTDLQPGMFSLSIIDGNNCEIADQIFIDAPTDIMVDLGDDQTILLNESVTLEPTINIPIDSIQSISWEGLINPDCPYCLTQIVTPSISTMYSVSITSHDGCVTRDTVLVIVKGASDIFIPNVFSPNGDGINDLLTISTGAEIKEIKSLHIFDRWGTLVHAVDHLLPNDPAIFWDGMKNGEPLNPAVFAYRIILLLSDGHQEIRHGDITLIR